MRTRYVRVVPDHHRSPAPADSIVDPDKSVPRSAKRLGILTRLLVLLRPYRARFAVATVALLVASGIGLLYPQAIRMAVDEGVSAKSAGRLDQITAALVGVFLAQALFTWLRHYLMSWLGERVVADLRRQVFERLLALPLAWFQERRTGEITGRLAADVAVVESIVGTQLSMSLRDVVSLFGGIGLMFFSNWRLTLVMLMVVPPIVIGVLLFSKRIRTMSRGVQDSFAETSAHVQEVIGAIATVQSFTRETRETATYASGVERYFNDSIHLASWRGLFMATLTFAGSVGIAIVVWFGGHAVVDGTLTPGALVQFLLYTLTVAASLGSLAGLWNALQSAAGATERLFQIVDEVPGIADPASPAPLPAGGAITFDRVSFAYPSRANDTVLKDIDFAIREGELVAVVGRSGAGKSTLTALVQRFYDPTAGRVLVNGVDVKTVKLSELRGSIATVAQEPVLFSGTLLENIAYARPGATRDEVQAAAREAHAHDFIMQFPDGYTTRVGERGVKLSGGQRQRIAIARAILANPRILMLDEATSNLDAESESLVQHALGRLMKGRTTLVIAHRLSTVKEADRIIVFDAGRIVEQGSHDALIQARGVYHKLVEHQVVFASAA